MTALQTELFCSLCGAETPAATCVRVTAVAEFLRVVTPETLELIDRMACSPAYSTDDTCEVWEFTTRLRRIRAELTGAGASG